MNRLWLWISVVILGVVLFVSMMPLGYRLLGGALGIPRPPFPERQPLAQIDQSELEKFREQGERRAWLELTRSLVVAAVLGLAAGVLLTRWLVAPLRQLEQGAKAIARHELSHRVPLKGSVEIRSVATSFNQMAAELERQETLRRKLLADVSHELRHPIHLIQGNLQAILDGVYPLNMEEVDKLLKQTANLTDLVDDLHELSLAEARELPLYTQPTDLVALLDATVQAFQPLASLKGIALLCQLPPEPLPVQADVGRLRQAVQNVLGNALQYTQQGGEIRMALARQGGWATLSVEDNGMGISAENLPRVFDRFYRADSSRNRNVYGTGLGLAIAQAIIQAHGGEIQAASRGVNQGSTFTIRLPIQEAAPDGLESNGL
ncbi:MAG: ATP-binding protein [Anaerolineales bacterium]|nr:ATP-binding protein [Anaerolineales bacterium]